MEYRVFPPIGLARLGNSPSIFVGPEVLGSAGRELSAAGETEIVDFKDGSSRVKKQAARFRLFQRATAADPFVPAVLPAGAKIRWSVGVANKKDGIVRPGSPPPAIPAGGLRPQLDPTRANRVISANNQIDGASGSGKFLDGTHVGVAVRLGELRTDASGQLLVVPADGISNSRPVSQIGDDFYNNVNWHDDVCDGPVSAEVVSAGGAVEKAVGSWIVVGPPDFAPAASCIVNLYDVIRQMAIAQGHLPNPTATKFTEDIFPLLQRARSLRWAHGRKGPTGTIVSEKTWNDISGDFPELAKKDAGHLTLRSQNAALIGKVQTLLSDFTLTTFQLEHLARWEAGTFDSNWTGIPAVEATPSSDSLTRAALDRTAGQGFFPGIEGGRILTDPSIYLAPFDFRIDHAKLTAGDVTALMAQPWQADFQKCRGTWWPSQRPDIAPQAGGGLKMWARVGPAGTLPTHQQLVDHVMKLGVIKSQIVGGAEVGVEEGHDPAADAPGI